MTHTSNLDKATQACFNGGMTTTNEFRTHLQRKVAAMTNEQLAEALASTTSNGAWIMMLTDESDRRAAIMTGALKLADHHAWMRRQGY